MRRQGQNPLTSAATANVIKTIKALAAKYSGMGMASSLASRRPPKLCNFALSQLV
jgi:hypothetical protein